MHIAQKHSRDLLYFEFLHIVLWFNPFIYFFRKNIAENNEFLADTKTVKNQSKKTYVQRLLNTGFGTRQFSIANSFLIKNSLKTRIVMLYKKPSIRFSKLKFLALLPLIFLMLTYVSCSKDDIGPQEKVTKGLNTLELNLSEETDDMTVETKGSITFEQIPNGYIAKFNGVSTIFTEDGAPVQSQISGDGTEGARTLIHHLKIKSINSEVKSIDGQYELK